MSWHPEPDASAIDVFSMPWNKGFFYVSTFQSDWQSICKNLPRPNSCNFSGTRLAHTDVVSPSSVTSNNFTNELSTTSNNT